MRRVAGWMALIAMASAPTTAHDVITTPITFAREISRLIYSRCADCHRPGGSAFSLTTYDEARPWAKAIKEEVLERRMPPWGAVKGFGAFRDDRGLTQEQINLIAEWVEGGAPEGDTKLLPKAPGGFDHPPAQKARAVAVADTLTLKTPLGVAGIQPKAAADGATLMVTAQRPDGSVEPLLWLYDYHARFARPFWYERAMRFPAGTKISVTPSGNVELLVGDR